MGLASIFILLWSSGYLFAVQGLQYCDPMTFLFLRLWLAWFIIASIFAYKKLELPISWRELGFIATTGFFAQGIYQVFFFLSLMRNISPGVLSIILGAQPLLVLLVLRENVNKRQIFGIFIGFVGVALTVSHIVSHADSAFGICSALLALMGISAGTVLQKKYCSKLSIPLTSQLLIQYFVSAIFVSFICLLIESSKIIWTVSFTISLLWITFIISIAGTYLYYFLLQQRNATDVSGYFYCVPPITAIMDYILFHHPLPMTSMFGMLLVVIGLILANHNFKLLMIKPSNSV